MCSKSGATGFVEPVQRIDGEKLRWNSLKRWKQGSGRDVKELFSLSKSTPSMGVDQTNNTLDWNKLTSIHSHFEIIHIIISNIAIILNMASTLNYWHLTVITCLLNGLAKLKEVSNSKIEISKINCLINCFKNCKHSQAETGDFKLCDLFPCAIWLGTKNCRSKRLDVSLLSFRIIIPPSDWWCLAL